MALPSEPFHLAPEAEPSQPEASQPSAAAPPGPRPRYWRSYKERLAGLAQRVVDAQAPIRILDAVKWPPGTWEAFRDAGFREPPRVDYSEAPLTFDAEAHEAELRAVEAACDRELGADDAVAGILKKTAHEYAQAIEMLRARGTPRFYELSRELYGSAKDFFPDRETRVCDVARDMYEVLTQLDEDLLGEPIQRNIPAEQVVELLRERLSTFFDPSVFSVQLDDSIVADASTGSDYIKVRQGAWFAEKDVRMLEVHEGWVHLATSLNGAQQPVARWLRKTPPRAAAAQEGLAALIEVLTYSSYPARARRINDRVLAVDKAEDGASFVEVFEWFRTEGYDAETCFWNTQRVFRGGPSEGGAPFTKDVVYTRGMVETYEFLRSAIAAGRPELIRWLFVGKVALEDVPILATHAHEGVVQAPRYVPPLFHDLAGLSIWLGVSTLFGRLKRRAVLRHYERLFDVG